MNATETKITCPYCGKELNIDELYIDRMEKKVEELAYEKAKNTIKEQEALNADRTAEAVRNATEQKAKQIKDLMDQIQRLTDANEKASEDLRKMVQDQFDLQQKLQDTELESQKKAREQLETVYDKARKEADDAAAERIALLEKKVQDANKALEESQRKLDQGSQQLQGEIQELRLEECLRTEFPFDRIEEVDKGRFGADVVQTVIGISGRECGTIVWESKNVRNWSNDFIPKLRDDVQRADGTIGVLVSGVFGKNMEDFTLQDGVWLVKPENALAMARLLRDGIERASNEKFLAERRESIQDAVYEFVTSQAFRNRVENISRQYRMLDAEIGKTKDYMERHFATQRRLIDELISNTEGVVGDISAYVLLPGQEDVPAIDGPTETN